jgi:hypothetical protein
MESEREPEGKYIPSQVLARNLAGRAQERLNAVTWQSMASSTPLNPLERLMVAHIEGERESNSIGTLGARWRRQI